jgi:hypothetical protein
MEHYAGIDVSLESASVCVVDATGRIVREAKVASEPEVLIGWLKGLGLTVARIGLEAGPLSQWLYAGMRDVGLPVRPWKNAFAKDGGPTSAVRLRQGLRADPGTQARIACSSGLTPMIAITRLMLAARTWRLISVLTRFKVRVKKWVEPIQALMVPNGCSTVCRRTPIASGIRSSLACIASRTPSCFQRLIRFSLSGVHLGLRGQVKQAVRWR